MTISVLYCGMADDILTPILFVPDFKTIYVICLFDEAFARNYTWEGQKEDIKQMLTLGHNKKSHHFEIYKKYQKTYKPTKINGACKIIKESDEGNFCWKLEFMYQGELRKLIYFHHTNFENNWDESIKDISHIFSFGAPFPIFHSTINKMLKERTAANCKYYDQFTQTKDVEKVKGFLHDRVYVNKIKDCLDLTKLTKYDRMY